MAATGDPPVRGGDNKPVSITSEHERTDVADTIRSDAGIYGVRVLLPAVLATRETIRRATLMMSQNWPPSCFRLLIVDILRDSALFSL
ncbi:hypothetical protein MRB53_005743 [Persea americana]|uniref:Uncharacterized protein n=1 Tax=Persea americana TaxID=3435 RepID=A0ACC2MEA3_PERAE|nr:hypothetical protein MRB53_005743 [Persea americana]